MIPSLPSFTLPTGNATAVLPGEALNVGLPLPSAFNLAGLAAPATTTPTAPTAPPVHEEVTQPETGDPEQLLQLLLDPTLAAAVTPPLPPMMAPAASLVAQPQPKVAAQPSAGHLPLQPLAATSPQTLPVQPSMPASPVMAPGEIAPLQPLKLRTPQDAQEASKQVVALMQTHVDEPLAKLPVAIAVSAQAPLPGNPAITESAIKNLPPLSLPEAPQEKATALRAALGERLQMQVEQRSQKATIRLDPPNLGKVDISLHYEGGKLQVQIQAAQPDVYRALQQVSQELRGALSEQNHVAVNVQISQQQQQQGEPRQAPHQQHTPDAVLSNHPFDEVTEEQRHRDNSILTTV